MARLQWSDFGSIWKTIREVDVGAIRAEAEQQSTVAIIGQNAALRHVDRLLREAPNRYPLSPEQPYFLPLAEARKYLEYVKSADLHILALDAHGTMTEAEVEGLRTLSEAPRPHQLVFLLGPGAAALNAGSWQGRAYGGGGAEGAGAADLTTWGPYLDQRLALAVDPDAPGAGMKLCGAVLDALPHELRLAAARRLPGLRPLYASRLTTEVSVSNAAVALASGVPSIVPVLGIPLAAADTIILTKNQVMMVYRLALACGAEPDFQKRMLEITPVIGGAVVWRQIAGALVGLVPGYGIVPKVAVAFGGTYVVGLAATRWYETGLLTDEERKRITSEAAGRAKEAATVMVGQAKAAGEKARSAGDRAGEQAKSAAQSVADRARTTRESMLAQARQAGDRMLQAGRKVTRRDKEDAPPE